MILGLVSVVFLFVSSKNGEKNHDHNLETCQDQLLRNVRLWLRDGYTDLYPESFRVGCELPIPRKSVIAPFLWTTNASSW